MILSGTDICHETGPEYNLKDISSLMAQLLVFNAVKSAKKDSKHVRTLHPLDRETMLPLYMGLTVHNKTRRKDLVDILYEKGLSAGRADSIQNGASTSRGQWAHQVMVAALYILKCKAYKEYAERVTDSAEKLDYQQWSDMMDNIHPQFAYWNKTMELEILFLQFMKCQREANYEMYVECLGKMVPWMFAKDHVHYARWLTVHSHDLILLKERSINVQE
ncbi:hypothetical protein DPMN_117270 [Dreissena polymorpha]|uniref:Uncharacterized protein n=1 Tax=Dreissena polymorpha TaxID=45954 RepID=A0A9D4KPJ3_DREPO|nr:hypothetical protein DPMN_117270 [Dreissena polymorpha]